MLFNSLEFLILVIVTFVVYYLLPTKALQVMLLIIASFVFYAFHNPMLLLLLILSASINAICSYNVYLNYNVSDYLKKVWAISGIAINLVVLAFFKYFGLIVITFVDVSSVSNNIVNLILTIPLPIGISFFTFQGISLVVDVYSKNIDLRTMEKIHGKGFVKTHIIDSIFYICFFPQLVAGPIVKAKDFYPQITKKSFNKINWHSSIQSLILGYFFKTVIADNLNSQTFWLSYPYFERFSSFNIVGFLFGYSIQIFADFQGYSLIAIGIASLFGYHLRINFNFPYIATSIKEFWVRWHISLSSWLRDYLYIPLGGNRKGKSREYFNIMTVMLLGGLWHGAAWSYLIWGAWHAMGIIVERLLLKKILQNKTILPLAKIIYVFVFVTIGWLFFKLPDFLAVIKLGEAFINNMNMKVAPYFLLIIAIYSLPVLLYHINAFRIENGKGKPNKIIQSFILGVMLFLIVTNMGAPSEFIYFQF